MSHLVIKPANHLTSWSPSLCYGYKPEIVLGYNNCCHFGPNDAAQTDSRGVGVVCGGKQQWCVGSARDELR